MRREFRDDLFPTGHPTGSRYAIETENDEGIHFRHKDTGFGGNESTLPLKTVEEIISEAGEDASWIVEDILARGALTEFSGLAKKGGKTTFWCHAIAAGARKEDHAGFATEPARYLYLTEQGNNFAEFLRASGLAEHPEHVKIVQFKDVSTVKWESLIRQAGAEINRLGFDALVVDTFAVFARLKGSEENDAGAVADRMRTLRLVAQQHDIAVVLIRHAGKDGTPRGSSAFEAEADICVTLSRPEGRHSPTVRRISGIGRYGEWERNIELVGERYVSLGTDNGVEFDKAIRFIRSVLAEPPEVPMKKRAILDKRTGPDQDFSDRTMARALTYLIEQGEVGEKQLSKKRGRPKVYWLAQKLSEVAPSASGGDALIHSRQTSTATSNDVENKGKRTKSVNGSSPVQGGEITIGDLAAQQPKTSKSHAGSNGGGIAPDSTPANTGSASANSSKAGTGNRAQAGRRLTDDEVRRVRDFEREGLSADEARARVIATKERPTGNRSPPEFLARTSVLRERTIMGNREKITEVLRRSPLTPLTYSDIKATADVPAGSFDRTLAALVRDGTVLKGSDGYRLAGDGSAIKPEETRAGSGIFVYCARCDGSHPSPDKGSGETFEDVHNRAIAP